MCGIFGLVWRPGVTGVEPQTARAAAEAMRRVLHHRGPDGSDILESDNVLLGHRRLAIIDLAGGHQPMVSPDGATALSYNGECYNFLDLRSDLEARGWRFRTRSDSEVLLAGHFLDGEKFDRDLNGMYAYAVLDRRGGQGHIQLSTDPMGIKPLFLYEHDGLAIFSSEIRAIAIALAQLGRVVDIDCDAVAAYLRLGWVPAPLSLIRHVRKLGPGERWRIDLADASARKTSQRLRPSGAEPFKTEADLDAALEACLVAVVQRQTISDVPLGFFLSGGIDSSLVLAGARASGIDAQSFSIAFTGAGHGVAQANEIEIARAVAKQLQSEFHAIEVDESVMRATLGETLASMDQPLADPACLPLLLLSRFAREQVTVCLSGDGGDELFAGYPRHAIHPAKMAVQQMPAGFRSLARGAASLFPAAPGSGLHEILRKARVLHGLLDNPDYVAGPFAADLPDPGAWESWNRDIPVDANAMMDADIEGQLAGQMLPKTDNMTMATSLECRVPLLDLELHAIAGAIPLDWKRNRKRGKLPLRRLLDKHLPRSITERPKQGFRVPLTSWFRGPMADQIRDRLTGRNDIVADILGEEAIAEVLASHGMGKAEHSVRIWALLAIAEWQDNLASRHAL